MLSEDHEGGRAARPAFAEIGTFGGLTDGIEFQVRQDLMRAHVVLGGPGLFEPGRKVACARAGCVHGVLNLEDNRLKSIVPHSSYGGLQYCRLSLRERTRFRGAKGDKG